MNFADIKFLLNARGCAFPCMIDIPSLGSRTRYLMEIRVCWRNVIKTVFQRYSRLMKFKMKQVYMDIYSEKSNIATCIVLKMKMYQVDIETRINICILFSC